MILFYKSETTLNNSLNSLTLILNHVLPTISTRQVMRPVSPEGPLSSWNRLDPSITTTVDPCYSIASAMFWIHFYLGLLTGFLVVGFLLYNRFRILEIFMHPTCVYHLSWSSLMFVRIDFTPSSCLMSSYFIVSRRVIPLINRSTHRRPH